MTDLPANCTSGEAIRWLESQGFYVATKDSRIGVGITERGFLRPDTLSHSVKLYISTDGASWDVESALGKSKVSCDSLAEAANLARDVLSKIQKDPPWDYELPCVLIE